MRGDATLTARLLLRPTGLAGLAATVGGLLAVVASMRPWYDAVAQVAMLGEEQERTVAAMPAVPGLLLGWVVLGVGLLAVVIGVTIALDRPPAAARLLLLGCAAALLAAAVIGALRVPEFPRVAGEEGVTLRELGARLPTGVELHTSVDRGEGPLLVAVAALLAFGGAATAREL